MNDCGFLRHDYRFVERQPRSYWDFAGKRTRYNALLCCERCGRTRLKPLWGRDDWATRSAGSQVGLLHRLRSTNKQEAA